MKRRLIQFCVALSHNLNLKGFAEVSIYRGKSKGLRVPGLSYYSCPEAAGSCPLDTLQNALFTMNGKLPLYILGVLLLFGVTMGRTICGSLYPFGLVQELLYRIPVPKTKKNRVTQEPSEMKYVVLVVFVVILPAVFKAAFNLPAPAFCKYTCPAGTLEGGIPLAPLDDSLSGPAGALFHWRALVLAVILVSTCFLCRSLCRVPCPLGAIYSLFTPVVLPGMRVDRGTYADYGRCVRTCKVDARQVGNRECIQCGGRMKECNVDAIYWRKPWGMKNKK